MMHDMDLARATRGAGDAIEVEIEFVPAPTSALERASTIWCLGACLFALLAFAIPAVVR